MVLQNLAPTPSLDHACFSSDVAFRGLLARECAAAFRSQITLHQSIDWFMLRSHVIRTHTSDDQPATNIHISRLAQTRLSTSIRAFNGSKLRTLDPNIQLTGGLVFATVL
jgi:hypothetical protein